MLRAWQIKGALIGATLSVWQPQIPHLTPAGVPFRFISNVVTKFCKADPGQIQPTASRTSQLWLAVGPELHNKDKIADLPSDAASMAHGRGTDQGNIQRVAISKDKSADLPSDAASMAARCIGTCICQGAVPSSGSFSLFGPPQGSTPLTCCCLLSAGLSSHLTASPSSNAAAS